MIFLIFLFIFFFVIIILYSFTDLLVRKPKITIQTDEENKFIEKTEEDKKKEQEVIEKTIDEYMDKNIKNPKIIEEINKIKTGIDPNASVAIRAIFGTALTIEGMAFLFKLFPKFTSLVTKLVGQKLLSKIGVKVAQMLGPKISSVFAKIASTIASVLFAKSASNYAARLSFLSAKQAAATVQAASVVLTAYATYSLINLGIDIADVMGEGRYYFSLTSNKFISELQAEVNNEINKVYVENEIIPPIIKGPLDNYNNVELDLAMSYISSLLMVSRAKYFEKLINALMKLDENNPNLTYAQLEEFLLKPENIDLIDTDMLVNDVLTILCDDPNIVRRINNGEKPTEFIKTDSSGNIINIYNKTFCSYNYNDCKNYNDWNSIKNNAKYEKLKAKNEPTDGLSLIPNVTYVEYKNTKNKEGLYDGYGMCVVSDPTIRLYCNDIGIDYNETLGKCVIDEVYCKKMMGTWAIDPDPKFNPYDIVYTNDTTNITISTVSIPKYDCNTTAAQFAAELLGGTVASRDGDASRDFNRLEKCGPNEKELGSACISCPPDYPKMVAGLCYTESGAGKCMEGYDSNGAGLCIPKISCKDYGLEELGLSCGRTYQRGAGIIPDSKCSNSNMRNDGLVCWHTPNSNGCNTCTGGNCWGGDCTPLQGTPQTCGGLNWDLKKCCPSDYNRIDGTTCWKDAKCNPVQCAPIQCSPACTAESAQLFCKDGFELCDGLCYPKCNGSDKSYSGTCTTCKKSCPEKTVETPLTCTKEVLPANGIMPLSRRRRHITGIGIGGANLLMGSYTVPQKAEQICKESNIPFELPNRLLEGICWEKKECKPNLNNINGICWDTYNYNERPCTCDSLRNCTCDGIYYKSNI